MDTVKNYVDGLLNTSGVVTANDYDRFIENGVHEIYKILLKQGSIDEIRLFVTAKETPHSISNTTGAVSTGYPANLSVFTSTAPHKLQVGDKVYLENWAAATELNETTQIVKTCPTTTTFTLNAIYLPSAQIAVGSKIYKTNLKTNFSVNPISGLDNLFADNRYYLVQRYSVETNNTYTKEGVSGNWYAAREMGIQDIHKASDPSSIEYATERSPIYWRDSITGEINVKPNPSSQEQVRVFGLPIQTIVNTTDPDTYNVSTTGIDKHWPRMYWTPLYYYCTSEAATKLASKMLFDLTAVQYNEPASVSRLADAAPALAYGLTGIVGSPPSFTKPTVAPDATRLDAFLDDDDSELASVAVQKFSQQIQQYSQDIQNELGEYTKEAKVWELNVQHQLKDADGDLQALISNYQNEVGRYQTNVQTYAQDVINQTSEVTSLLQKHSAEIAAYKDASQMYYQKFISFMTSRVQPPSQEQGGKRAR